MYTNPSQISVRYPHLLLSAGTFYRSMSAADVSAQQQTRWPNSCCCRSMEQTDGRTDALPLHQPCSAYYAGSVNNKSLKKERKEQ